MQQLTNAQEKLIRSLHRKKGRAESGKCLVEGEKFIEEAGEAIDFVFRKGNTGDFDNLVTTQTPQGVAAVATTPTWTQEKLLSNPTLIILDGVQDPGNVGAIVRLCLGFNASLFLVESVDVTNPKVIRSSAGAMFHVPWKSIPRDAATDFLNQLECPVFRLEKTDDSQPIRTFSQGSEAVLIVGSEGHGISLKYEAPSLSIAHDSSLESLNVGNATAIALHERYRGLS